MRPRVALRRLLWLPPSSSPTAPLRTFTHNTAARTSRGYTRPQLPFLGARTAGRQPIRYLTTERKAWLLHEVGLAAKYTIYFWMLLAGGVASYFVLCQEYIERRYPTPREWSFRTRMHLRGAQNIRDDNNPDQITDWVMIAGMLEHCVKRLEDAAIDGGPGVRDETPGSPPGTKDVTAMPESWRRGYYQALMAYAQAAEQVDGWVRDRTRGIVFPPDVVIGPSNPWPRPVPVGAKSAPKEEDCDVAFDSPDTVYLKILATEGFTPRQRVDTALAYANWLEFKGVHGPAGIMYEQAVSLSLQAEKARKGPTAPDLLDPETWTLRDVPDAPSANLLKSLTAYATFRARAGDPNAAMPIFISLLRARRRLPKFESASPVAEPAVVGPDTPPTDGALARVKQLVLSVVQEPPYPSPPDDGTAPPARDAKELCEEAATEIYIGEILFASPESSKQGSSETALSWTRNGVDVAEEQLHRLGRDTAFTAVNDARKTCQECLGTGLANWAGMVAKLARVEAERRASAESSKGGKASGWLGLWGEGEPKAEDLNRWAAEEKVLQERRRRVRSLLEDAEAAESGGLMAMFKA